MNPWVPMTNLLDLKVIGKLGEELNEAGAAIFRCIIQGINESQPVTGKINRTWLEDELADVRANYELAMEHFQLDSERMRGRIDSKKAQLHAWHAMVPTDLITMRYEWIERTHSDDPAIKWWSLRTFCGQLENIIGTVDRPGDEPTKWTATFHWQGRSLGYYFDTPDEAKDALVIELLAACRG
jgi:hypothetical protein